MTKNQVIQSALQDAVDWRESFLDAIRHCESEEYERSRTYSEKLLAAYKRYQKHPRLQPVGEPVKIRDLSASLDRRALDKESQNAE